MKNSILFLISMTLIPAAFAQQTYKEKVFVFSPDLSTAVEAADECAAGIVALANKYAIGDINPTLTAKLKIKSIDTWTKTGKVIDDAVKEIGEILICQDWATYPPATNLVPVYYEITISGRKFIAEGAGTSPNFPELPYLPGGGSQVTPPSYLFPVNVGHMAFSATVLPAIAGRAGGVLTSNWISDFEDNPDDEFETQSVMVLRVLLPVRDSE